ncbi:ISAs1 family transposase [Aquabacterium sp.]|uniref:ISAs1 family transposase n=1 Tax=Aquabacterium sp. TaxID=1872578 RepID=UPI003D00213F
MLANPQTHFANLPDPRRQTRNKLHKLEDIVMITLCAVLCGFEDWVSIEDFGHENEQWLRGFLELRHGIPSHDTLSDVMGRIDRTAFARAFGEWMQQGLPALAGRQVALDGKTVRGSRDGAQAPVHLMSAFATQARLVLGVQAVADKSNEITAIPDLLAQLELAGAVVTIDAMGCQKSVAQAIVEEKADYVLAHKDNQPTLHEDIATWLDHCDARGDVRQVESIDKDHGRLERRRVVVSTELDWLEARPEWAGLKAVAMVESAREAAGKSALKASVQRRYYLCSITEPARIAQAIREHWSIENQQHWVLDVQFGEDRHRARKDHSAANLALIRRAALNLLRDNDSSNVSIRRRKMRCGTSQDYRRQILFGERPSPATEAA